MRLVGASFSGRGERLDDGGFQEILRQAVDLLRGKGLGPEEADEYRARLLAGFRWILVDEYQDIGSVEYGLISALAGRTLSEEDDKISLFAVGDDDQNIYTFNGSSVEFIRHIEEDYGAKPYYLIDNYRSSANIIAAANAVIQPAKQRVKAGHPIRVNRSREKESPGGEWAENDPVSHGRVQILPAGDSTIAQAQTVVDELKRLASLTSDWDWSTCAVVAREWSYLDPVRSLCELEGIPVQMANDEFTGVWNLRETQALLNWLRGQESRLVKSVHLNDWIGEQPSGTWTELLHEAMNENEMETGGAESPVDYFAEWSRSVRRRQRGLLLATAHRAKGLEFGHVVVLDGGWDRVGRSEDMDAPRRLYYVAMTRARKTLALARFPGPHRLQDSIPTTASVLRRQVPVKLPQPAPELSRHYCRLNMNDVFLSFAGYRHAGHQVHQAIETLSPGDPLVVRVKSGRWELLDVNGTVVGQLRRDFNEHRTCRKTSHRAELSCTGADGANPYH